MSPLKSLLLAFVFITSPIRIAAGPGAQPPLFTDYPVDAGFGGHTAPLDLNSHPKCSRYRTRLKEAATQKPSFAGYYIVAEWGCGSACQQVALIDARTGAVHFPPFTTTLGNRHRLNSRLFVVDAPEDISAYYEGQIPGDPLFSTTYWLWDEAAKQFHPVHPQTHKKPTRTKKSANK